MTHSANNLDYNKYYNGVEITLPAKDHMKNLCDMIRNEIACYNNGYDIAENIYAFKNILDTMETISRYPEDKMLSVELSAYLDDFIVKED